MAQTFLNLAQGVTGTLPTSNYVDNGRVLQVVTATSDTNRTTTSSSFTRSSDWLKVDITPSSSSNKVFIHVNNVVETGSGSTAYFTIYRDGTTNLGNSTNGLTAIQQSGVAIPGTMGVLDSPSSSSSVEYAVYIRSNIGGTTAYLGKGSRQTITAFEIKG